MKPFSEYSAEELAMDQLFIKWVQSPNDIPIKTFWEGWLIKFPEMTNTVDTARELVKMASDWTPDSLPEQEAESMWDRIQTTVKKNSTLNSNSILVVRLKYYRWAITFLSLTILILLILLFKQLTV